MAMRRIRNLPMLDLGAVEDDRVPESTAPVECGCRPPFRAFTPAVRCMIHQDLLRQVLERFTAGMGWERNALWQEADGTGRRGYVPPGGRFDVNVISLSSPASIERMARVMNGFGPLDDGHPPLTDEPSWS